MSSICFFSFFMTLFPLLFLLQRTTIKRDKLTRTNGARIREADSADGGKTVSVVSLLTESLFYKVASVFKACLYKKFHVDVATT